VRPTGVEVTAFDDAADLAADRELAFHGEHL
jgi:hypothetical protein